MEQTVWPNSLYFFYTEGHRFANVIFQWFNFEADWIQYIDSLDRGEINVFLDDPDFLIASRLS
jgi:hypothetical protein